MPIPTNSRGSFPRPSKQVQLRLRSLVIVVPAVVAVLSIAGAWIFRDGHVGEFVVLLFLLLATFGTAVVGMAVGLGMMEVFSRAELNGFVAGVLSLVIMAASVLGYLLLLITVVVAISEAYRRF